MSSPTWPPAGAVPLTVEGLYEGLASAGYGYGPVFQGLRAAWRRGNEIFAEVTLPAEAVADAGAFGIHPALLDAALHASKLGEEPGQAGEVWLPFAWTGVSVHAAGASMLRARLTLDDGGLSLTAADAAGLPVISVDALVSRLVAAGRPDAPQDGPREALFAEEWIPVAASAAGPAGWWAVVGADAVGLMPGLAEGRPAGAGVSRSGCTRRGGRGG